MAIADPPVIQEAAGILAAASDELDDLSLEQLAERFRQHWGELERLGQTSHDKAFNVGLLLEASKRKSGHGSWLGWIQRETHISARTAQRYMEFRQLVGNASSLADLDPQWSIGEAIAALKPKGPRRAENERPIFPVATPADVVLELLDAGRPFPARTMRALEQTHGVDLLVTSWPYCLGETGHGYVDFTNYDDWLDYAAAWTHQLCEVLAPNGRVVVNLPIDVRKDQPEPRPIGFDGLRILRTRLRYAAAVVWAKSANGQTSSQKRRGSPRSPNAPALTTGDELLLVVHKGSWNLGRPGEPNDLDDLSWTNAHWVIAGRTSKEYPHVMSREVAERCIQLLSFPGALVADFHCGEGTTAVAAMKLGRKFVGGDLNATAVAIASRNVQTAHSAQMAASR